MRKATTPEGLGVQSCLPCRAVWLNGGAIADAGWGEGLPQPNETHAVSRMCARCRAPLTELVYEHSAGELRLDYCEVCAGMFLPQGAVPLLQAIATGTKTRTSPPPAAQTGHSEGETSSGIVLAPTGVVAGRRSGARPLSVLAVILAAGAVGYFYMRQNEAPAPAPTAGEKIVKTEDTSVAASALFTAVPALQEYYRLRDRWPADAAELDLFAVEQNLSFRSADFAELSFEEKKNGGLVLRYTPKGAERSRTFHLRPPTDAPRE